MKTATSGPGSSVTGVTQGSPGSQELHYVLRVLGPAACRNSELFCDVANDTLRISMLPASKRGKLGTQVVKIQPDWLKRQSKNL